MVAKNNPNELYITRIFDAPVEAVWDAWTDPEQVAKWWGPRGFTLTTHAKELRPGGFWKYTMHGPDGTDYPNYTLYHEVVEHAKLVYDHGGNDDRPPLFRVTVLFHELGDGRTEMEMTMTLATAEVAAETKKFIKKAGGDSTWDRLAEYLEKESSGKETFVINRCFDAPLELMFDMWSDPKHVSKWMPPTGFVMEYIEASITPGGSTLWVMTGPKGMKMYGRAKYLTIDRPHTLVYTQEFCDEEGKLSRHPAAPTWPAVMLTHVQLTAEGPQRTRVTVTWEPHGDVTSEELATFVKGRSGMTQGWTGSFDKLEALIAGG